MLAKLTKTFTPDHELIDDENPELTAEFFANARPASEVLPHIFGAEIAARILQTPTPTKSHTDFCLKDNDLAYLRSTGKGWQTRLSEYIAKGIASGAL